MATSTILLLLIRRCFRHRRPRRCDRRYIRRP